MQYQTRSSAEAAEAAGAAAAPAGSLLMSSAWIRLAGALALIGVLWLAVAWALAGVGG